MKQFKGISLTWYFDIPRQSHGKIGNKQKNLPLDNLDFFPKMSPMRIIFKRILYQINYFPNSFRGYFRSSRPEVFLRTGALKICTKFTG